MYGHIIWASWEFISRRQCSEHVTIGWLSESLVLFHLVEEADEGLLHGVLWAPVGEHVELGLNLTVALVNAWQVDLRLEFNSWWGLWVVLSALNCHHVNSIVEGSANWSNDGSVPLGESLVSTYPKYGNKKAVMKDILKNDLPSVSP